MLKQIKGLSPVGLRFVPMQKCKIYCARSQTGSTPDL